MNTNNRMPIHPVIAALLILCLFPGLAFSATIRIMPLGDSITRGITGSTDSSGYRKYLYDLLVGQNGYDINFVGSLDDGPTTFDNDHEGHSGWYADGALSASILPAVQGFLTANPADIVLLHIGTNDISTGQSPESVAAEIEGILEEIAIYEQNAGKDVWVVVALIINRATGCSYRTQTTSLNDLIDSMSNTRRRSGDKILAVDMEIGAGFDYDRPSGDMYDCLHPYITGYEKMADEWLQVLMDILPRAAAGPDQNANPGVTVNLDGTDSTDLLATIGSYAWRQTAGSPTVGLANSSSSQASFKAPIVSGGTTLTFRLTITDSKAFSHSDECNIVVNGPPIADAGTDQRVNPGVIVALDGSHSSDPGGSLSDYLWVQTGGSPAVAITNAAAAQASFSAPAVGTAGAQLTFQLTVTDNLGAESSDTVVVTVNAAPVADAGPDQIVQPGVSVTLDGAGSTDDGNGALSYAWMQTAGPPVSLSNSAAAKPAFSAPSAVTSDVHLTFQLTVTDSDGLQSSDSCTVTVSPDAQPGESDASGGGGGGGGGCFITTAGDRGTKGSVRDKF
jgi:lysophospholipase L1-like esterase